MVIDIYMAFCEEMMLIEGAATPLLSFPSNRGLLERHPAGSLCRFSVPLLLRPQVAKLHGKSQPVGRAAALPNDGEIGFTEGIAPNQVVSAVG